MCTGITRRRSDILSRRFLRPFQLPEGGAGPPTLAHTLGNCVSNESGYAARSCMESGAASAATKKGKAEEVGEGRKPLLSADCLTCNACGITVPSKEHMGSHMMTDLHVSNLAIFYGLKPGRCPDAPGVLAETRFWVTHMVEAANEVDVEMSQRLKVNAEPSGAMIDGILGSDRYNSGLTHIDQSNYVQTHIYYIDMLLL